MSNISQSAQSAQPAEDRLLLYFWAIGDLHYRALPAWNAIHTQRLAPLFQDLHQLWQVEGPPAFCVSPGDIVETCALESHQLAKASLEAQLGNIPLYTGVGNHEYYGPNGEDPAGMADTYCTVWKKPLRYAWKSGEVACIMLDYPNPATLEDMFQVYISPETLAFLEQSLTEYAASPTIIFLHCPLYNTVLDREPEHHRDYHSLQNFFSPENSQEIRSLLAKHNNAFLFFSGHTHSGWEAPNLVCTEQLGAHPVSFVNLMSPWYTGRHTGPRLEENGATATYVPDEPDILPTFAIRVYSNHASIRIRDHKSQQWLKEWRVPLR